MAPPGISINERLFMSRNIEIQGYRILEELGRGGMGRVYKAVQLSINRVVALKTLEQSLFVDEGAARRMVREARISGGLRHENLVKIHDAGESQGTYYISMELLAGGDLADAVANRLAPAVALRYTMALAGALDFAHRQGFVHRDIKPENILLREDDTPVITDFGIARPIDSQTRLTMTGAIIGTPQFMSPEQTKGLAVDGRSDLYSLASVLFFMLTGETVFKADSFLALTYQQVHQPIPKLVSPHHKLQWFFDKALAKQPEDRFQSGAEMKSALKKLSTQLLRLPQRKITFKRAARDSEASSKSSAKVILYVGFLVSLVVSLGIGLWNTGLFTFPASPEQQAADPSESEFVTVEQNQKTEQSAAGDVAMDATGTLPAPDQFSDETEDQSKQQLQHQQQNTRKITTDSELNMPALVPGMVEQNLPEPPVNPEPPATSSGEVTDQVEALLAEAEALLNDSSLDSTKIQQLVTRVLAARTVDPANTTAINLLEQLQSRLTVQFNQHVDANEFSSASEKLSLLKIVDPQADQSGLSRKLKQQERTYQREQREIQKAERIAELAKDVEDLLQIPSLSNLELVRNDYQEILALESNHPEGLRLREAFLQEVTAQIEQSLSADEFEQATEWVELLAKEPQSDWIADNFKQKIAKASKQSQRQLRQTEQLEFRKSVLLGQINQLLEQATLTKERIQQAEAKISELLRLDSDALSNSNQQRKLFDAYHYLAKRYMHQREYDEAMQIINLAITKQPTNTTLLALRQDIKKALQRRRRNISSF